MPALQTFDGTTVIRKGTKRPIYVTATAATGVTVTIAAGATFTLIDTAGAVVTGFNAVTVTGYDSVAALSARVWYILDTAGLAVGYYVGEFTFTVTGSDGLARIFVEEVQIEVRSTTADFFTFDPSTDVGTVRMLIADIDPSDFTFNDVEIARFIALQPANLYVAAALALEAWITNRAYIAGTYRASNGEMIVRRTIAEMQTLAKSLRNAALSGTLQTGSISVSEPNEYLDSFREEWRDFNGIPVIE